MGHRTDNSEIDRSSPTLASPKRCACGAGAAKAGFSAERFIELSYYPGMLLDAEEAADYFRLSRSHFDEVIRPNLPWSDYGRPGSKQPMPRWAIEDLHAYHISIKRGVSN